MRGGEAAIQGRELVNGSARIPDANARGARETSAGWIEPLQNSGLRTWKERRCLRAAPAANFSFSFALDCRFVVRLLRQKFQLDRWAPGENVYRKAV